MRSYPINSAQAAARIMALTIISDGNAAPDELASLCSARIFEDFKLDEHQLRQIIHELCNDLDATARHGMVRLEPGLIDALLGEIVDSTLRRKLLQTMWRIADADDWLSDGEALMLSRASVHWRAENCFR